MDANQLFESLKKSEDRYLERKPAGVVASDIRKTIVAFANSTMDGQEAILFIGVTNDGKIEGVSNPDKLQKTIRRICENDCYPPVTCYNTQIFPLEGKQVLAVIVGASHDRPQFSGPAYVRQGSESVAASKELYEELIASRVEKARVILGWKNQTVTVEIVGVTLGGGTPKPYHGSKVYRVEGCTPHYVTLRSVGSDSAISESLEGVEPVWDTSNNRPKLILKRVSVVPH